MFEHIPVAEEVLGRHLVDVHHINGVRDDNRPRAYYAGAIDVPTLKTEQARIGADIDAAKDRLGDLDANLGECQEILELASTLATRCGDAYRKANDRTRKQFKAAVFERLDVRDGRLCHEQYRPPFDDVFSVSEFEYETRVVLSCRYSNGMKRGLPR